MNSLNPRKPYASFLAGLAVALTVAACGGGGGGDDDKVALDKPDDLMAALDDKVTANGTPLQQVVGQPPDSTGLTPKIETIPDATAVPGETVSLPINFPANTDLQALFAKVPNAGSYFQATVEPGSKISKAAGSIAVLQTIEFQVEVPANLATGGQFCLDVKLKDTGDNIGQPARACVTVVDTPPAAPTNDQPATAQLGAALAGSWATNCINIESEEATAEDPKGAKLVLSFAAGSNYQESIEFYSTAVCTGSPSETIAEFIYGAWESGDAVYSEQARRWQRPFTFNPTDPPAAGIDFEPCYNVLSFNAAATQLYLGLPSTFTFDTGQGSMPGDCSAEDTRPAAVLIGLPFIKR